MKEEKIKIGIDIDGTITASLESLMFFQVLTEMIRERAEIFIITNREEGEQSYRETEEELKELGIKCDHLIITSNKKASILENKITIYFDDSDEYFQYLPREVTVFKIREDGNFNFRTHKWVGDSKTVELLDMLVKKK